MEDLDLDSLGSAGRRLYDALHDDADAYSLTVLIVEAARIKDRLDRFDRILSGDVDTWIRLDEVRGNSDALEIHIDSAMTEARQQANALRQLLAEIRRYKDVGSAGEGDDGLDNL